MKLSDNTIREGLKNFLFSRTPSPKLIIDEMLVNNGSARADVVAFYKTIHCFEIKSDLDSFSRLENQVINYDYTFKKCTLVTTEKNLKKSLYLVPSYWGIMIARENKDKITFKYIRKAKENPKWCSEKALLALWKSEIIDIDSKLGKTPSSKRASREIMAKKLSKEATNYQLTIEIRESLVKRFIKC